MPLAVAAKALKRLKTAMGSYSFGATSASVWRHIRLRWRHVRLGLAPHPLGTTATPGWGSRRPFGIDETNSQRNRRGSPSRTTQRYRGSAALQRSPHI
jgi:hypothetical protein